MHLHFRRKFRRAKPFKTRNYNQQVVTNFTRRRQIERAFQSKCFHWEESRSNHNFCTCDYDCYCSLPFLNILIYYYNDGRRSSTKESRNVRYQKILQHWGEYPEPFWIYLYLLRLHFKNIKQIENARSIRRVFRDLSRVCETFWRCADFWRCELRNSKMCLKCFVHVDVHGVKSTLR